tara:strand:+ start:139 stop:1035 length:897 start_codon:yes stop_codon:yes gene_type:complete
MKNYLFKIFYGTMLLLAFSGNLEIIAQEKVDVVIMTNGEIKQGKVTGVTETQIKFRYTGEDIDYEFAKSEVSKVQFASGRVEEFSNNAVDAASPTSASALPSANAPANDASRHNKIAVLPFDFISNENMETESMRNLTQNTAAGDVREQYQSLDLQDPMVTNATLAKNNITFENLKSFTPSEIAVILGVEYVMYGTVHITNKGTSTYGGVGTTYNEKDTKSKEKGNSVERTKGSSYTSANSSTTVEYDTSVDLRLFNDQGKNLYSDSRHAFGNSIDAYEGSVSYMIKRTPFGSKYGKK